MTMQDVDNKIRTLSIDIMKYEDGDLALMMELMDKLEEIKAAFPSKLGLSSFFDTLLALMQKTMHGQAYEDIEEVFTEGIDLLTRLIRSTLRGKIALEDLKNSDIYRNFGEELTEFIAHASRGEEQLKYDGGTAKEEKPLPTQEPDIPINSDIFKTFQAEAEEKVVRAQDLVLMIEEEPGNKDYINELFRVFHTIKGECGFLKIAALGDLAHNLESLLDLLREGKPEFSGDLIDLLLAGIDYTRSMLDALKNGDLETYNSINTDEYIQKINEEIRRKKGNIGKILVERGKLSEVDVKTILEKQKELKFTRKFGEIAVEQALITQDELEETLSVQKGAAPAKIRESASRDSIIKVRTSQINFLVDMVGELLIIEAQMDDRIPNISQLKKTTKTVQHAAMQLRTEKIKNLFLSTKRIVRDASHKLGKPVSLVLHGEDLEIDRDLVEKLEEPLMHLVRNAISHGIEDEEEREAAGKPLEGTVIVEAERRGNTIVIGVEDDGAGLDREKILAKAVEKGLLSPEDTRRISDEDAFNLIFVQGFSTTKQVDLVSGRGVGMDIVKTVTTEARGRVEIKTEKGKFTRFEMIFPLSTAIIDGMIVKSQGIFFIIPVSNIIESLELKREDLYPVQENMEVIKLREEVIPIIKLRDYFHQDPDIDGFEKQRMIGVIVENNSKRKITLLLDEIITKREVFIKSLGTKFSKLPGITSGTILQGGMIGFVIDVDQISKGIQTLDNS